MPLPHVDSWCPASCMAPKFGTGCGLQIMEERKVEQKETVDVH
jgi:hypothetical protein